MGGASLFSDEDEDNLFSSKPNVEPKAEGRKPAPAGNVKSSLFDKDDGEDDLFFVAAKPKDR